MIAKTQEEKETADIEMFANGLRIIKQKANKIAEIKPLDKTRLQRIKTFTKKKLLSSLHKLLKFPRAVVLTWYLLAVLFGGSVKSENKSN